VSLSVFQRELARMVADPNHRRRIAAAPEAVLTPLHLDERERRRLTAFAHDPGMRVNTVLYRANRLAPIYSALPRTCDALADQLGEVLREFWSSHELEDLQFPNEAARFVAFLRRSRHVVGQHGLAALVALELAIFELLLLPRSRLRAQCALPGRRCTMHLLVRAVAVDVDPTSLIAAIAGTAPPLPAGQGAGGVLVDHRFDPGCLWPLSPAELAWCRAVRPGRSIPKAARSWLADRNWLIGGRTRTTH